MAGTASYDGHRPPFQRFVGIYTFAIKLLLIKYVKVAQFVLEGVFKFLSTDSLFSEAYSSDLEQCPVFRGLFSLVFGRREEKRPPAEYQGKEASASRELEH